MLHGSNCHQNTAGSSGGRSPMCACWHDRHRSACKHCCQAVAAVVLLYHVLRAGTHSAKSLLSSCKVSGSRAWHLGACVHVTKTVLRCGVLCCGPHLYSLMRGCPASSSLMMPHFANTPATSSASVSSGRPVTYTLVFFWVWGARACVGSDAKRQPSRCVGEQPRQAEVWALRVLRSNRGGQQQTNRLLGNKVWAMQGQGPSQWDRQVRVYLEFKPAWRLLLLLLLCCCTCKQAAGHTTRLT